VRVVTDIVLTRGDPDHAGGRADFSHAFVHVLAEERARLDTGDERYSAAQFVHGPRWVVHGKSVVGWMGLEARWLSLGSGTQAVLLPLFGHTLGQCGVAVRDGSRWLVHLGDAYYLRWELSTDDDPVSALAAHRGADDVLRRKSLEALRRLLRDHAGEVEMFGYHDFAEFPAG